MMNENSIAPEKITHPFQLMAAWFVMLILQSGVLLAAAIKITTPPWISVFLVVSTVTLSLLVMLAVFLMLTKYRPHLQGPKEYAEWLKDVRQYVRFQTGSGQLSLPEFSNTDSSVVTPKRRRGGGFMKNFEMFAVNLPESGRVIDTLRNLGFIANIYDDDRSRTDVDLSPAEHEAIWIGKRVPVQVSVKAIKAVAIMWTHLKYLQLSDDDEIQPPDCIHDQIFFGGSTSTAKQQQLKPWSNEEIAALSESMSSREFKEVIRAKYGR